MLERISIRLAAALLLLLPSLVFAQDYPDCNYISEFLALPVAQNNGSDPTRIAYSMGNATWCAKQGYEVFCVWAYVKDSQTRDLVSAEYTRFRDSIRSCLERGFVPGRKFIGILSPAAQTPLHVDERADYVIQQDDGVYRVVMVSLLYDEEWGSEITVYHQWRPSK